MASAAIHTSRLGGHAFNDHSTSDDVEAEYDRLRDLARAEGDKMQACFDQSRAAYQSGDGATAKHLSEQGKRHKAAMERYNKQASELIFRANNHPARVTGSTIDLHGQFVREAEAILEARIRADVAAGQGHLHVIVGKGKHSAGGVQKLKPCVEKLCRDLGLEYATEDNEGRIYVDLKGRKVTGPPPALERPDGYEEEERPQTRPPKKHRPPRPPQQQRPPRKDEEEDEGFLGFCLKACCSVM